MCAMSTPTPLSKLPNFDPRQVPVTGIDAHLPPVPAEALTLPALRRRFQAPPPWQPELRQEPRFTDRVPAAAAVLVPLVDRPQGLSVRFTRLRLSATRPDTVMVLVWLLRRTLIDAPEPAEVVVVLLTSFT